MAPAAGAKPNVEIAATTVAIFNPTSHVCPRLRLQNAAIVYLGTSRSR